MLSNPPLQENSTLIRIIIGENDVLRQTLKQILWEDTLHCVEGGLHA